MMSTRLAGAYVGGVVILVLTGAIIWVLIVDYQPPPKLKTLDWWENTVIYQVYIRSYKDSNGDGIGDIKGLTSKLNELAEAGVKTIWPNTLLASPMRDFGYDISDFYTIHHEYGTMEDFDELLEEAHRLGLKLLMDFVPNHASIESEYFKRSVAREPGYENFFVWSDPRPDPQNASRRNVPSDWLSIYGASAWEWNEVRQQYYMYRFGSFQPDFNFRDPGVKAEMLNIIRFWLEKGVDGFRLDALPFIFEPAPVNGVYIDGEIVGLRSTDKHLVKDWIENAILTYEWRDFIDQWQKNGSTRILLAESYTNVTATMLYYGNEKGRNGVHFPINFGFVTVDADTCLARDFVNIANQWFTYMPYGAVPNWSMGNHDNNRTATKFGSHMVDGLIMMPMMLPGVAITYQGEELGMTNGYVSWEDTVDIQALGNAAKNGPNNHRYFTRDPMRTPYHWDGTRNAGFSNASKTWLPVADNYLELNLRAQKFATNSHYKVYREMIKLRQEPALSHGYHAMRALTQYTFYILRFLRSYNTYTLVFNVGKIQDTVDLTRILGLNQPITVYETSVDSNRSKWDIITKGEMTLDPGEALVLQSAPVHCDIGL